MLWNVLLCAVRVLLSFEECRCECEASRMGGEPDLNLMTCFMQQRPFEGAGNLPRSNQVSFVWTVLHHRRVAW